MAKCNAEYDWREDSIYIWVDSDELRTFGEHFGIQDDRYLDCTLCSIDTICVDAENLMRGYGFTMKQLWDERPGA
jgi:hypothetical protein